MIKPEEKHPIEDNPKDKTLEERVRWLELHLGELWDEVWWHQLPWYRRFYYWIKGFRSPIDKFYGR